MAASDGAAEGDCTRINRVAFLFNPATATFFEYYLNPLKVAASVLRSGGGRGSCSRCLRARIRHRRTAREPNGGLVTVPDTFLNVHRKEVTSLAARYRLPAIYPYRYYSEVGGLIYYGPEPGDPYRRAASYVDRSSKARSLVIFQCKRRPSTNSLSISRPQSRSASPCPRGCSREPTR